MPQGRALRRAGHSAFALTALVAGLTTGISRASAATSTTKHTHVSTNTSQTSQHRLGLVLDRRAPLSAAAARKVAAAAATLPTSVDLTPLAPPVGNQGPVGSCAAWASDYTALGYWLDYDNRAASGYLEPMYTYSQVDEGQDNGSSIGGNLQIAATQGVDVRPDYTQGDFDWLDQPTIHEKANAANWKLSSYQELPVSPGSSALTQQSIEAALASGTPVVIGIPVYYNFETLTGANNGLYSSVSGPLLGYHAITALGYNSTGLRIENSWTTGWAASGFATLSWSFVNGYVDEAVAVNNLVPANNGAVPTVTALAPTSVVAAGGTTVTVTGTNLTGATVTVGGTKATVVTDTATSITFNAPAEPAGQSSVVVTTQFGTAASSLSYIGVPTITSVTPASGTTAGATAVTLSGTNLTGATISVGGVTVATTTSSTATSVGFTTPAHAAGPVTFVVKTTAGTASSTYTYVSTVPVVTSESPTSGPSAGGTQVTLSGSNLTGATVTVGGASARITSQSATSLVFTTPAGSAGASPVVVTGPGGTATTSFAFVSAPVVISEAPIDGAMAGGTKVTVTGSNLAGATVSVGGVTVANTSASTAATVTFTTPAHALTANTPLAAVAVTLTTPGGTVSIPYVYAVVVPA